MTAACGRSREQRNHLGELHAAALGCSDFEQATVDETQEAADPLELGALEQPLKTAGLRVPRVSGDFNGDGGEDTLIVTGAGTYEYLGRPGSGFAENAWVRSDLTLNSVEYFTGDFNRDGKTDFLVVTGAGTYEYLGKAGSGFAQNVWIRNDLVLGVADYF